MSIIANFKLDLCQLLLSNSQVADLEELLRLKDPWVLGFEECPLGGKKRIVLGSSRRRDNKMWENVSTLILNREILSN